MYSHGHQVGREGGPGTQASTNESEGARNSMSAARRCMVPRCHNQAMFELDVDPSCGFTPDVLGELATWLTLGHWEVCRFHGASVAVRMMANPEADLIEYDIEHDPRMYV